MNLQNKLTRLLIFVLMLGIISTISPAYAFHGSKKLSYDRNVADYPSIQDAINSLPPTGGVVFIPAGTYIISETIKIPGNVTLIGEGFNTYLKLADDSNINIIENMHPKIWIDTNIVIANMRIDGNGEHQTAPVHGIFLYTAPNAHIENVWAHSFPRHITGNSMAIYLLLSPNSRIHYNRLENNSYTGIMLTGSGYSKVSNNYLLRNHRGIYIDYSNNTRVFKNTIINCDEGIRLYGSSSNNIVLNNHVEGSFEEGIVITHPECENNSINANYLKDNTVHILDDGTNTKIRGNKLLP